MKSNNSASNVRSPELQRHSVKTVHFVIKSESCWGTYMEETTNVSKYVFYNQIL